MATDRGTFDGTEMDHPLLQRERTLAIVLAASEWPYYSGFHASPSFRRSAAAIVNYLRSREGLNLSPRNMKMLIDPSDEVPEILRQIRMFISERRAALLKADAPATDLLLYYIGHGGFGDRDKFFLSIPATDESDPLATSVTADSLGRLLRDVAGGLRTFLVLDCCFAASATAGFMSDGLLVAAEAQLHDALPPQGDAQALRAGKFPSYGTALLCASGSRERARAPLDLPHTMFTGGLLDVLRDGDPREPEWLSLEDVQRLVTTRLKAQFADEAVLPEVHAPQQRMGRVDIVPLFRNTAAYLHARQAEEAARRAEEMRQAEKAARRAEETRNAEHAARPGKEVRHAGQEEEKRRAEKVQTQAYPQATERSRPEAEVERKAVKARLRAVAQGEAKRRAQEPALGDRKVKSVTDPVPICRVLPDPASVERARRRHGRRKGAVFALVLLACASGGAWYLWRLQAREVIATANPPLVPRSGPVGTPDGPPQPSLSPQGAAEPLHSPQGEVGPAAPPPRSAEPPQSAAEPAGAKNDTTPGPAGSVAHKPDGQTALLASMTGAESARLKEPDMVFLNSGKFEMGSNDDPTETPIHTVYVRPFWISKYPITGREWRECVAANACVYSPTSEDDRPVLNVSWNAAMEFISWLSNRTGKRYRLPTEAEWEYAARGGTATNYWWGNQIGVGKADCRGCGGPYDPHQPVKVGSFPANPFGLYGMAGGAAQWVSDCWHKDYRGAPRDGSSWDKPDCTNHVLRGGSWRDGPATLRVSDREYYEADVGYPTHGFRVARSE